MSFFRKGHLVPNTAISRVVNSMRQGLDRQMTDVNDQIVDANDQIVTANSLIDVANADISTLDTAVTALQNAKVPWFDGTYESSDTPVTVSMGTIDTYYDIMSNTFTKSEFNGDSLFVIGMTMWSVGSSCRHCFALYGNSTLITEAHRATIDSAYTLYTIVGVWKPGAAEDYTVYLKAKRTYGSYGGTYTMRGLWVIGGWS